MFSLDIVIMLKFAKSFSEHNVYEDKRNSKEGKK